MKKLLFIFTLLVSIPIMASDLCDQENVDNRFLSEDDQIQVQDLDLILTRIDNDRHDGVFMAYTYENRPPEAINIHVNPEKISIKANTPRLGRGGTLEIVLKHRMKKSMEESEYLLARIGVYGRGYSWQHKNARLSVTKEELKKLETELNAKLEHATNTNQAVLFSTIYIPSYSCANGIDSYLNIIQVVPRM